VTDTISAPVVLADAPTPARPRATRNRLLVGAVVALALVGLGLRLWIMTGRLGVVDSDEAITGLMARHLLDGEFRAFMWRLSYQGTIATYPVALSFKLFGTSQFTLELPYLLMSAGATLLVWRIGTRFLSPFQAVFGALAFWLWPALYVWVGVKPLIFYVPTMVLGLAAMLCALRAAEHPRRALDWCLLGLFAGAGWWTSPNIMYFVVPIAVWLVAYHWRSLWPRSLLTVPFAVLGALPWLWNDITYGFDSLELSDGTATGSYLDHLGYFFSHALPAALGMRAPFTGAWIVDAGHLPLVAVPVLYVVVLGLLGVSVALGLRARSIVAIGLVSCPFVFALNPVGSNLANDLIGNGRYFYFFTPFVALAVAQLARPVAPAWILAVALAASSVWGFAQLYDHREGIGGAPPLDAVIRRLERDGHHDVYASFWVALRLTFESDERIVGVATDVGPSYQGYTDRIERSKLPVYVCFLDPKIPWNPLAGLRNRAREAGITLRETRVGDYLIVVPSKRMLAPPPFNLARRP
jgi:Dolichyl-phosphate-mannose-protein mannosyltransferase